MLITLIAGPKGHGKNYFASLIQNYYDMQSNDLYHNFSDDVISNRYTQIKNNQNFDLNIKNSNFYSIAFADSLKNKFEKHYNIKLSYLNKEYYRKQLQDFSQKYLKNNPNYFTNIVCEYISNIFQIDDNAHILITDFRKWSEYEYVNSIFKLETQINTIYIKDPNKDIDLCDNWENNIDENDCDCIFIRKI